MNRSHASLSAFGFLILAAVTAVSRPLPATCQAASATTPDANAGMSIERLDPGLDAVIAPGAKIERVATGFAFTEGPMWHDGRLWFSEVVGDRLRTLNPNDGTAALLLDNSGGVKNKTPGVYQGSNGMAPGKDGSVVLCLQGGRKVVQLDRQMHETVLVDSYEGKKLNSPNDVVFAPDGSFWFTDPPFGLSAKDQDHSPLKELPFNGVFRDDHGKLTAEITDLSRPNGIGFSPDGKTLYVSNSGPDLFVKAYDVGSGGKLSNGRIFIAYPNPVGTGVPDGLKVDMAGNVWTTGLPGASVL